MSIMGHARRIATLPEVAEITRTPEATLRYWRHLTSGGTPTGPRSWKLGRRVVYDLADVEAWLDQQRQGGGAV